MEVKEQIKSDSSFIRTDVTAVKLFGDFILAGIGSWIHVFDKKTKSLQQRLQALRGQKIYGFRVSTDYSKILVYGGKQFTLAAMKSRAVYGQDFGELFLLFEPVIGDDWFHDGQWLTGDEVVLLTAHNVVQTWDASTRNLLTSSWSEHNSILYSGLLLPLQEDVLVFSGTVFTEVIIHCCMDEEPLHYLKGHKGVIFSIACNPKKELIVTTSDDRSVRMWGPKNSVTHLPNTKQYWKNIQIECKYEVYGHNARVMRSIITSDMIISVGEDSAICYWDINGKLLRKNLSHQNGCIWCLDADKSKLVTGGGDCGVIAHPLSVAKEYGKLEIIEVDAPKKIFFTARRNIVILTASDELHYYDVDLKTVTDVKQLNHKSTYIMMSLSSCKQLIAVSDLEGNLDILAESCKGEPTLKSVINTQINLGKILSMQWAGNRHLVFCSDDGKITIVASKGNESEVLTTFLLPACKERWLTASAIDAVSRTFVVGDRCGNIHIYVYGQQSPLKTFSKVHGRYGPTSIAIKYYEITTTGRDGTVKHFSITEDAYVKYMRSKEVNLQWVEKFLDKNENVICGFQEREFVVSDIRHASRLLEISCGGGHRSWDAVRYLEIINDKFEVFIDVIYLKNAEMHYASFQLSKIASDNIIDGSHTKEINCLKSLLLTDKTVFISGGEDTTLRISFLDDFTLYDTAIFKNLSNVRALKTATLNQNKTLVVSAGGRAQICIKVIEFKTVNEKTIAIAEDVIDYLIKGTDKERKGNQTWRNATLDFDPETRIMDVDIMKINDKEFIITAGCSDACLRFFQLQYNAETSTFKPIGKIKYHKTCILKTLYTKIDNKDVIITCTTTGEVAFWDVTDLRNVFDISSKVPFYTTTTNKSGINGIDTKTVSKDEILFATGGDDNALHLNILNISKAEIKGTVVKDWHCSEITGVEFVDENLLLSTSIDQRVTLSKWDLNSDGVKLDFVSQSYSDVADVQGMEIVRNDSDAVTVCIFGKGVEVLTIFKPR